MTSTLTAFPLDHGHFPKWGAAPSAYPLLLPALVLPRASAPLLVCPECPGPTAQMTRPPLGLPASSPATPTLGCHCSECASLRLATKPLRVPAPGILLYSCSDVYLNTIIGHKETQANGLENNIEDINLFCLLGTVLKTLCRRKYTRRQFLLVSEPNPESCLSD